MGQDVADGHMIGRVVAVKGISGLPVIDDASEKRIDGAHRKIHNVQGAGLPV